MEEISEALMLACEISEGRKYKAGIMVVKKLLKRYTKEQIRCTIVSMKRMLDYEFMKGVKRGLNLYA